MIWLWGEPLTYNQLEWAREPPPKKNWGSWGGSGVEHCCLFFGNSSFFDKTNDLFRLFLADSESFWSFEAIKFYRIEFT